MRFKEALYDDSDPLYAPCTSRSRDLIYWVPTATCVAMGYPSKRIALPGVHGDGRDTERAAQARKLTRQMLEAVGEASAVRVKEGSWRWLIARYRGDKFSPMNRNVKPNTAAGYRELLDKLDVAIGDTMIADVDAVALMRWQDAMEAGHKRRTAEHNARLIEKGFPESRLRSTDSRDYVSRMFNMLRMLCSYAVLIDAQKAGRAQAILKAYTIKSPPKRKVFITEAQVAAVVAQADADGNAAFALGFLCQWWFALRAVDVRGQWLKEAAGPRWADGLTWDMIDKDLLTLRKTASKTQNSTGVSFDFDLTLVPDIRARLAAIPHERRVGPVITDTKGRPFHKRYWATLYRKYADRAGVPFEVKSMDARAGAISHASNSGATLGQMQRQAGHASPKMTQHYSRDDGHIPNTVISLRRRGNIGRT